MFINFLLFLSDFDQICIDAWYVKILQYRPISAGTKRLINVDSTQPTFLFPLRGMDTLSRETTLFKQFRLPTEERSTLKTKEFATLFHKGDNLSCFFFFESLIHYEE